MGLRDLIGDVLTFGLSGFFTPQANPNLSWDKEGNPIDAKTGKVLSAQDLQSPNYAPYVQPSTMANMFSPEARGISYENARAESQPNMQGREASTARTMAERMNINPLLGQLSEAGLPSNANQIYAMTGGQPTNPEQMTSLGRSYRSLVGGLPAVQSQTELTQAGTALKGAQAEAGMQPEAIAAQRAELANRLSQATGLTPLQIQDAIVQAKGQLGREPTEQDILGQIQKIHGIETGGALARAPIEQSTALAGVLTGNINAWNPTPEQFPFTQSPFTARLSLDNNQQPNINFGMNNPNFLPAVYNKLYAARALGQGMPGQKAIIDPDTGKPVFLPSQQNPGARGLVGGMPQTQLPPPHTVPPPSGFGVNPVNMQSPLPSGLRYEVGRTAADTVRQLIGSLAPYYNAYQQYIGQPFVNMVNKLSGNTGF